MSKKTYETSKDLFFTNPKVAQRLVDWVMTLEDPDEVQFVEPSCGNGSFLRYLPYTAVGFDVTDFDYKGPHKVFIKDFLSIINISFFLPNPKKERVAVGNPPFYLTDKFLLQLKMQGFKRAYFLLPETSLNRRHAAGGLIFDSRYIIYGCDSNFSTAFIQFDLTRETPKFTTYGADCWQPLEDVRSFNNKYFRIFSKYPRFYLSSDLATKYKIISLKDIAPCRLKRMRVTQEWLDPNKEYHTEYKQYLRYFNQPNQLI